MIMNRLYMLVGIPASGKTTWANNQSFSDDCVIISTDQYVEEYAAQTGKTHTEAFQEYMPIAIDRMADAVIDAREAGRNIIWDQTSTSIGTRAKKFRMLPNYYAIAVVFPIPERQELERRLASRPNKIVPIDVVDMMIGNWEEPTLEEGFMEIWKV
jgi:predicted kinase